MITIRIFISSPGDVAEERERARQVVDMLKKRYVGVFNLKPVLWEDSPLQAVTNFQGQIDSVLSSDHGIDIAVFILWSRIGSPLGPEITKPDGSEYRSGTEREFELMLQAREQNENKRPVLLVYTRQDETSFDERLRGKSTLEKDDLIKQKKLVEGFIAENFYAPGSRHNVLAHHSFDRPQTFSRILRQHLVSLLDAMAGSNDGEPVWDVENHGPPFMGLEAFDEKQATVFCGREDEILEARRALVANARHGCAFLLITGSSGSGKSSLARAGLLPAIRAEELDDMVAEWRPLVLTPNELGDDPVARLMELLAADSLLPELRTEGVNFEEVINSFRNAPSEAIVLLKNAVAVASRGKSGGVRILLLLDQLEEVFARPFGENLLALVESLARSGVVWVAATIRGDFMGEVHRSKVMAELLKGRPIITVLSPDADALRRMIEEPARLAGLQFEKCDDRCLSDKILADAARHADLLPLVEFVLRELYELRDGNRLTFDAYHALGGVEGALKQRAEKTFESLSQDARNTLPAVLQALVTLDTNTSLGISDKFVRQRAPLAVFNDMPAARALVDAFTCARLFTTCNIDEHREAAVTVAHESLLRVWNDAVEWAEKNKDRLRIRARVATLMNESRPLLEGDPLMDDAKNCLFIQPAVFTKTQEEWVSNAVSLVENRKARGNRRKRTYVLILIALTITSITGGVYSFLKERSANRNAEAALAQKKIALEEKQRALDSRRQADKILKFLSTDLREKLRPHGLIDIMGDVQIRINQYFEELEIEEGSLEQMWTRGLALADEAENSLLQGNQDTEESKLKESFSIFKKIIEIDPNHDYAKEQAVYQLSKLAGLLYSKGIIQEAEASYLDCLMFARSLPERYKHDLGFQKYLASYLYQYGLFLSDLGRFSEAEIQLLESSNIYKNSFNYDKSNYIRAIDYIESFRILGFCKQSSGNINDAIRIFDECISQLQNLEKSYPDDLSIRSQLLNCLVHKGDHLMANYNFKEAEHNYRMGLAIHETTKNIYQDKATYENDVVWFHARIAGSIYEQGNEREAMNILTKSFKFNGNLTKSDLSNLEKIIPESIEREYSGSVYPLLLISNIYAKNKNYIAAGKILTKAKNLCLEEISKRPFSHNLHCNLCEVLLQFGLILRDGQKYKESEIEFIECINRIVEFSGENSQDITAKYYLARAQLGIGSLYVYDNKFEEAERALKESTSILSALSISCPEVHAYKVALAEVLKNSAILAHKGQDGENAKRLFNEAAIIFQEFDKKNILPHKNKIMLGEIEASLKTME